DLVDGYKTPESESATGSSQVDQNLNAKDPSDNTTAIATGITTTTGAGTQSGNKPPTKSNQQNIPLKRRPRRTGQPLHLLLQDCSRQVRKKKKEKRIESYIYQKLYNIYG